VPHAVVRIDSIAAGGDGIGRADGLAVFVPRTAPGDEVEAELTQQGRLARGKLLTLVAPSPNRVEPPCRHYVVDRCGGCQLQHLAYEKQLEAKSQIIRDALRRIAKRTVETVPVTSSPDRLRYRSKLTLALRKQNGRWIAGLHHFDDPVAIFELRDCLITEQSVVATWRDIMAHADLLPDARALRASVRVDRGGHATFVLEGGKKWDRAAELATRVPSLGAIWWEPEGGKRRLVIDHRAERDPSASFGQVNPKVAALVHAHVIQKAMAHQPTTVIDAYAGAGATAVPIAERGVTVTAIELDPAAADWTRSHLPARSRALRGRVEDIIGDALPADVVILNPPRAGLDERVPASLERGRIRPKAVIYVSCDPATLARDLTRLPSFALRSVVGFDMFPHTSHVETVCELVPNGSP
jgi:23S rRNA (uracil1939-C5)-methyltransferase